MNAFLSPNCKIISVPVTPSGGNTQASYIFPAQQELQDRKIVAIETYCSGPSGTAGTDVLNDPLNPGNVVLSTALFNNCFLTLYTSAVKNASFAEHQEPGLFYDKIPLCSLRRVQNNVSSGVGLTLLPSFVRSIFMIRPTEIAWTKSKVEFPTSVALAANQSAVFLVHYLDKGDDGVQWMRSMGYDAHSIAHGKHR